MSVKLRLSLFSSRQLSLFDTLDEAKFQKAAAGTEQPIVNGKLMFPLPLFVLSFTCQQL